MLTATVSGSFHRHISAIAEAVYSLTDQGVAVLSPSDPRIVDRKGRFWFVASDETRSIRFTEDRHLHAVAASDLLWLVAPDGYVGESTAIELGVAISSGVPIFATRGFFAARKPTDKLWTPRPPAEPQATGMQRSPAASTPPLLPSWDPEADDDTLNRYVHEAPDVAAAVAIASSRAQARARLKSVFLLDPHSSLADAHDKLDQIDRLLRHPGSKADDLAAREVYRLLDDIRSRLTYPICVNTRGG